MRAATTRQAGEFFHTVLDSGVEFAADVLPQRNTVAMCFRVLTGLVDDPAELTGISSIVARTLAKGTRRYDGRGLADAFDGLGATWSSVSGRQTTLVQVTCLPEFALEVVELVGEMLCHPTFPEEACRVAVELARQELRTMEDEPHEVLRALIQRLTLGPVLGRYPGGEADTLPRITPEHVREHWERFYDRGRMQVAVAGPVEPGALARRVEETFRSLGSGQRAGREAAEFEFKAAREHRQKELEQQYLALTLPGVRREDADFAVEQVVLGVLAGGMSGRLFTEVREKLGLVYWVGAWHEQPRGKGVIHLGASTTPERCRQTYETMLRELERLSEDLSEAEVRRAREGLIAHYETEDDLTRARAAGLSDDLFHFSRPVGLEPRLAAIRAVTLKRAGDYVGRLAGAPLCVATLGPRAL